MKQIPHDTSHGYFVTHRSPIIDYSNGHVWKTSLTEGCFTEQLHNCSLLSLISWSLEAEKVVITLFPVFPKYKKFGVAVLDHLILKGCKSTIYKLKEVCWTVCVGWGWKTGGEGLFSTLSQTECHFAEKKSEVCWPKANGKVEVCLRRTATGKSSREKERP